ARSGPAIPAPSRPSAGPGWPVRCSAPGPTGAGWPGRCSRLPSASCPGLPSSTRPAIDGPAACPLGGLPELFRFAHAAQAEGVLPEAPGADARPGEVLGRVADVAELPVEDADQPARPDHQVADPEVAVDQHQVRVPRGMFPQPAQ